MRKLRSQAALEVMLVIAMMSVGVVVMMGQMDSSIQGVAQSKAEKSLQDLADSIKNVQVQGNDASETVEVFIPDNVVPERTRFENGAISLALEDNGEIREVVVPIDGCFSGEIPTDAGTHQLTVKGGSCATIGFYNFKVRPVRITQWLKPGEQETIEVSIDTSKPAPLIVEVDAQLAPYIDLDPSEPGLQSQLSVEAPVDFSIVTDIPLGSSFGTYSGSISIKSGNGVQPIPVQINIYTSSLELSTYADSSRSDETDLFYTEEPLYFRTISKRNDQLFATQINFTLQDPSDVVADQGIEDVPNGILDGEANSLAEVGYHTLTVHDLKTGEIVSKVVEAVKAISWKVKFDTGTFAPEYSDSDTYASMRFQLQDQLGNPIKGLIFNDVEEIIPFSSDGWKYVQEPCHGADACTPAECPLPGYLNGWQDYGFDDSAWDDTSLAHTKDIWTTIDSTRVYRKHFTLNNVDKMTGVEIRYLCDEGCECYVNGELIEPSSGCQLEYTPQLKTWATNDTTVLNEGDNVIACRVVEKALTQTDFRYFDVALDGLYDQNAEINLKRMIASAPGLNDYYTISEDGDWYVISFNPQELSSLPQGGNEEYMIYVETNYNDVPSDGSVSFNIGKPISSDEAYRIYVENPNKPNVELAALDVKVLVLGQTGLRILDHKVVIRVHDLETGDQIKKCSVDAAGGDEYYHCFLPQTAFEVNKTYKLSIKDTDVKPQGVVHTTTFNIVTPE
jgi:type II secretory pathway pseudopilin PulG